MSIYYEYQCKTQEEYEAKIKEYQEAQLDVAKLREQGFNVYAHLEIPIPPRSKSHE